MSREYDLYLREHRENVKKGFEWIKENLPELLKPATPFVDCKICLDHDKSKDQQDEYDAYDKYFYGNNKSYKVVQDFNYAWLLHIHRNPHHWQHWVLINDNPKEGEIILDMPYDDILEMCMDWWAFSWKKENLREIFGWYDQHKDYMKLSDKTRRTVDSILGSIKTKLDEIDSKEEN